MTARGDGTRCLVMGAAGFIGSHLVERLLGEGQYVTGLDNLSSGRVEWLAYVQQNPRFAFIKGSLLEGDLVKRAFTRLLHLDCVDRAMSETGYSLLKADLVRASALREGREPLGNGQDGLEALRLLSALYQSGRTGQTVWL